MVMREEGGDELGEVGGRVEKELGMRERQRPAQELLLVGLHRVGQMQQFGVLFVLNALAHML